MDRTVRVSESQGEHPRIAPDPGRVRIRDLLDWTDVDRCRLLIASTIPLAAAYALRTAYLLANPSAEPYYDPRALVWMRDGLLAACGVWALFLAWGSIEQRRAGPHTVYLAVGALSLWFAICGIAYALGAITSPAWIAVIIGGVLSLFFLPRGVALLGICVGMTLMVASLLCVMADLIPYAPMFRDPPISASQVALPYLIGNTIISVLATLIVLGAVGYIVPQWRRALSHLVRVNTDLERIIEDRTRELARRKRAEAALRENEDRYRLLAENAGDLVAELNADGFYEYVSPSYQTVLGYAQHELLGTDPFELIHPDDREETRAVTDRIVASRVPETRIHRLRHQNGEWRWVETYGRPFSTRSGESHLLVVAQDISERKRAEEHRQKLEAQMQQTQKLEILGVLAGGIAHDFNNLLVPILGNARLAEDELEADSHARRLIERVATAALRASELTNELLAYAGKRNLATQSLDLRALLREMAEILRTAIPRKVELVLELPDSLPPIVGDPAQLRQVIMNLITNASEAIGDEQGAVTISAGTTDVDRRTLSETLLGAELPEGRYVYLDVRDTGCGMDEATRAKIFDPFFTTKFTGRGLGLAALLGIVRAHKGALKVESEPGRGSWFGLLFPCAVGSPAIAEATDLPPLEWRGSGTILVAEDDDAVRELLGELLPRYGMSVLSARNGREAVEQFSDHEREIAAVLLDVTMPEIGGLEAFLAIRKIRPDARVILTSGYSEIDLADRCGGEQVNGFLHKPYQPAELIDTLRQALEN